MRANMTIKILFGLAITSFGIGCAAQKPMYYWGDYSTTLYHCKKNPSVESLAKHKEILEKIVEESTKRNLRIPPGVCAELGYLYAAQNDTNKAIELFNMEKNTYPESTILMDRLIIQTAKRTSDNGSPEELPVGEEIEQETSISGGVDEKIE